MLPKVNVTYSERGYSNEDNPAGRRSRVPALYQVKARAPSGRQQNFHAIFARLTKTRAFQGNKN